MESYIRPISILLVNLFYPERHPTIGFPVNVESLVGDLEGEFGDAVAVSVLDMQQPGVPADAVLERTLVDLLSRNRCAISSRSNRMVSLKHGIRGSVTTSRAVPSWKTSPI